MSTKRNLFVFLLFRRRRCLTFVVWLILDCYIEDEGAMKSNAFFRLRKNRVSARRVKLEPREEFVHVPFRRWKSCDIKIILDLKVN